MENSQRAYFAFPLVTVQKILHDMLFLVVLSHANRLIGGYYFVLVTLLK